jgi:hypothetical protein
MRQKSGPDRQNSAEGYSAQKVRTYWIETEDQQTNLGSPPEGGGAQDQRGQRDVIAATGSNSCCREEHEINGMVSM